MEHFLANHFDAILSFIAGILGGLCLKLSIKKNNDSASQKNITTHGDVAGHDINKNQK